MEMVGRPPPGEIEAVRVVSFREAVRLDARAPTTTEEAQYSLPFPVAAALVHGRIGGAEIDGPGLGDAEVLRLSETMLLAESADYSARFPAERWAEVEILLKDGRTIACEPYVDAADVQRPLSDAEITEKFRNLTAEIIDERRRACILDGIDRLAPGRPIDDLIEALLAP
jgi:2-methylcitrate dehydratase PrpD